MPSTSPKQKRFMAAAANDAGFAAKAGIPQDVAQEFNRADNAVIRRRHGVTHFPHKTYRRDGR
jgi:hypothetical protein